MEQGQERFSKLEEIEKLNKLSAYSQEIKDLVLTINAKEYDWLDKAVALERFASIAEDLSRGDFLEFIKKALQKKANVEDVESIGGGVRYWHNAKVINETGKKMARDIKKEINKEITPGELKHLTDNMNAIGLSLDDLVKFLKT